MSIQNVTAADAPDAIGPYSHATRVANTLYLSGLIALDPESAELVNDTFDTEARRVFANIAAVLNAANASFADIAKLTVYLTDLSNFDTVNVIMSELFSLPYPARAAIGVAALPRGASIEIEVIAILDD